MNLDVNGEVVVVVRSTKPNKEADDIGDLGKSDGSINNSTKTDGEDNGSIEESGGSEDDGMGDWAKN